MTRDYVRSARPARKRKPARRSPSRRPAARAPFPLFRALLALALLVGFGVFLYHISGSAPEEAKPVVVKKERKPIPIEEQRPAKERFDYMSLLENKEVPVELPEGASGTDPSVDQEQLKQQTQLREQEAQRAAALLAGQPAPPPSAETKARGYLMQCGAFRNPDQAQSMKLRLAMQGQASQVQSSQGANGTWHKVILGPFASQQEAAHLRSTLASRHVVDNCTIWLK